MEFASCQASFPPGFSLPNLPANSINRVKVKGVSRRQLIRHMQGNT